MMTMPAAAHALSGTQVTRLFSDAALAAWIDQISEEELQKLKLRAEEDREDDAAFHHPATQKILNQRLESIESGQVSWTPIKSEKDLDQLLAA